VLGQQRKYFLSHCKIFSPVQLLLSLKPSFQSAEVVFFISVANTSGSKRHRLSLLSVYISLSSKSSCLLLTLDHTKISYKVDKARRATCKQPVSVT